MCHLCLSWYLEGVHVWWGCKQLVGWHLCALLSLPSSSTPAIRATQEVRGQGQPAIPDQGYLLLLLNFFFFFWPPAESETGTQAGSRETRIPSGEQIRTEGHGGRVKPGEGEPRKGELGMTQVQMALSIRIC